ncbi:hypothetical protein MM440_09215 [Arsenicicoccus piscis]|uniref:ABC-2 type transport system permease protein n=1 Tax=Arsenicicoccus piscis TaxID=673954 RepID=A0ABQ6HQQ7_9MICO|nr:hypothetical protein [Arsenicicoccus piscis]MCH8627957.1 hypothetical protein [Arsenicicoccus piscis]GMA20706.1 hypothetical protein GCM10025862_27270 [Arsenicicoccus piscis]
MTDRGESLYRAYLVVLGCWVYLTPLAIAATREMSAGGLQTLASPHGAVLVAAAVTTLLVGLHRLAVTVAPIHAAPGVVGIVIPAPLDRARVLSAGWWRRVAGFGVAALFLAGVTVAAGGAIVPAVAIVAAGGCLAWAWRVGQLGPRRALVLAWLGTAALTLLVLAATVADSTATDEASPLVQALLALSGPGGWLGLALLGSHGAGPSLPAVLATVALVLLAGWATFDLRALRRIGVLELSEHAGRLAAATTAALVVGNLRDAQSALGRTRSRGRALRLSRAASPVVARDRLGLRRAPDQVATAAVLVGLGSVLQAITLGHHLPLLVSVLGVVVTYVGLGPLVQGLRQHVVHAHRDSWLGLGHEQVAWQHLVTPAVVALAVAMPVTLGVALLGHAPFTALVWTVPTVLAVAVGQVADAYAGSLPPGMATGVMTAEIGDTGAIRAALWLLLSPLLVVGGCSLFLWAALVPGRELLGLAVAFGIIALLASFARGRIANSLAG